MKPKQSSYGIKNHGQFYFTSKQQIVYDFVVELYSIWIYAPIYPFC